MSLSNLEAALKLVNEGTSTRTFDFEKFIEHLELAVLVGDHYDPGAPNTMQQLLAKMNGAIEVFATAKLTNVITELKFISSKYLPKLEELVNDIWEGQRFLNEGKDGKLIDNRRSQTYYLLQDLRSFIGETNNPKLARYMLFLINISLAYTDDYLECNESTRIELSNLITILKSEGSPLPLLPFILHKAEFLKYKIEYRNAKNEHAQTRRAIIEPPALTKENYFYFFYQKIQDHFNNVFEEPALKKIVQSYNKESIRNLTLEPFHHLNRFYRKQKKTDLPRAIQNINELYEILENLLRNSGELPVYDQIAIKSVINLTGNTRLKLELDALRKDDYKIVVESFRKFLISDNPNILSTILDEVHLKVQDIATANNFPDYYCYLIFTRFIREIIEEFVEHPAKIIDKSFYESDTQARIPQNIELLKDHIKKIGKNNITDLLNDLKLMISHKVKPLCLTKKETLTDCKDLPTNSSGKLFLDSTYILPINFLEIRNEVMIASSLLNPSLNNLQYALDAVVNKRSFEKERDGFDAKLQMNLTASKTSFEGETKKVTEEVKKSEFRTIQIVAMFVSIATFVLINVKIFDNKSSLESFAILIGLAGCFSLFNLFFYTIYETASVNQPVVDGPDSAVEKTKSTLKNSNKITRLVIITVSCFLASLTLLLFERKDTQDNIKALSDRVKADSLVVHSIDSMQRIIDQNQKLQGIIIDSIIDKRGRIQLDND